MNQINDLIYAYKINDIKKRYEINLFLFLIYQGKINFLK